VIAPLPADWYPRLWAWMQEDPDANGDDTAPKTCDAFEMALRGRAARGEQSWGFTHEGTPIGAMAFQPLSGDVGTLHGICFTRAVHGTGLPRAAVAVVLTELHAAGMRKICASYLVTNARVERFLQKLGFVIEGTLRDHTTVHGHRVSVRCVALFSSTLIQPRAERLGG
jgi:RimJ/RimL family protein N-acetyltransferase